MIENHFGLRKMKDKNSLYIYPLLWP